VEGLLNKVFSIVEQLGYSHDASPLEPIISLEVIGLRHSKSGPEGNTFQ